MSKETITVGLFSQTIVNLLNEYHDDCFKAVGEAAEEVAEETKKRLKKVSPKKSGKYKKGWAIEDENGRFSFKKTIHNKDAYQLTHLLENGHVNLAGGRSHPNSPTVPAHPHIAEVNDWAAEQFEEKVREKLT